MFYENLNKPFKKSFVELSLFASYNRNNLTMNLKDKNTGYKIVPSLTNVLREFGT